MNKKIPSNAFEYYFSLGPGRSYQAVAAHYVVSKQAITKAAARERWPERLRELEQAAQARSSEKAAETLEEMTERHLKILRAVQNRAIEGLKAVPLATARDILRALEMVIRQERTIRGEPGERGEMTLEEITRREIQTLLILSEDDDEDEDAQGGAELPAEPTPGSDQGGAHAPAQ